MPNVKAILIDPFACKIEHVEVDGDDINTYYRVLSHESMPVTTFTTAYAGVLKGRDAIFVDDEGIMKNAERWFHMATGHQPFAGKGLIVGADRRGNAADAESPSRAGCSSRPCPGSRRSRSRNVYRPSENGAL
jgi:hypothetical protein